MIDRIEGVAQQFAPISLADLNERAALQTRAENKYFVPWETFVEFSRILSTTHAALEIKSKRAFLYDTQYFDTPDLQSYWGHIQGRRKRFKCRSRVYVDSALCVFEIKLKGKRGETVKHRIIYNEGQFGELNHAATSFLQEHLEAAYEMEAPETLVPMLRTYYHRVTLASLSTSERLTCDFNVSLGNGDCWYGQMHGDYALVEVKSDNGRSASDLILWKLGVRPTGSSKYCLGMSLMQPELPITRFSQIRREFFAPISAPPVAHLLPAQPATMAASPIIPQSRQAVAMFE